MIIVVIISPLVATLLAIFNRSEKREEWFEFKDKRLEERVMEWLEENEIELA